MADRYDFPANPASTGEHEGCAAQQRFAEPGDPVMCSPTVVAVIQGIPSCGWCTEAYLRGAA